MKTNKIVYLSLALLFAFAFLTSPSPVFAGDGTTGSIDIGATSSIDGGLTAVRCYDLTISSDYLINSTGDDAGFSFTTGSDQTEYTVYLNIDKPTSSEAVNIYLRGQANGTIIDQVTLQVKDSDVFPEDFLMDIGMVIIALTIITGIIVGIRKSMT